MKLDDLPTPCLVLELGILKRNLARMADAVARHPGLKLRPHMKTAKSLAVAALAAPDHGPITVSTVAEARYFAGGGYRDQIYAVGITPQKLDAIAAINAQGNDVKIITDDLEVASAIAAHPGILPTLIEVDCGEGRGGIAPDSAALAEIAQRLGARCAGIMTHAGHSYAERNEDGMRKIAEAERAGAVLAAERLRGMGITPRVVSAGSSPTALYGQSMTGITDIRAAAEQLDLDNLEAGGAGDAVGNFVNLIHERLFHGNQ
jgi:D-serine deaminase-like pyridoxal phosphate-dependent protein